MNKRIQVLVCTAVFVLLSMVCHHSACGAQQSVPHTFSGPSWNLGGAIPETHETPWLPPSAVGVRFKVGVRASGAHINLQCPVKVTFMYDPEKVIAGKKVKVKIKAEPAAPASGKSFESSFGILLTNDLQYGLAGVPGVPDSLLPWTDLDYDLWDLLGEIPKVGQYLAQAKDQIGVNMASDKDGADNILPLGTSKNTKEYHDTRALIDIVQAFNHDDTKAFLLGKVKKWIPASALSAANSLIGASNVDELLGDTIQKFMGLLNLKIKGDPYFKVEGHRIDMMLNYAVPGRTTGTYPLSVTSKTKSEEIDIHIPYFAGPSDNFELYVSQVGYHFTLYQVLNFQLSLPIIGDVDIVDVEKTVTQRTITQSIPANEFKISVPVKESTEVVGDFHVHTGCLSATAFCGSKYVPMKCSVAVQGPGFNKTFQESTFRNDHAIPVNGLSPDTQYTFEFFCRDEAGLTSVRSHVLTGKTKKGTACEGTSERATCGSGKDPSWLTMENLMVTPHKTSLDISWTTDRTASTEVYLSPSPDLRANYVSYVKKSGGVTAGYFDAVAGDREMTTNHTITIPNLAPGTVYYFIARSYSFANNDPAGQPLCGAGIVSQGETLPLYLPATVRVRPRTPYSDTSHIPITIKKTGTSQTVMVNTIEGGLTPPITLERGASYTISAEDTPCFNCPVSKTLNVSATAEGELPLVYLDMSPLGGYVYDQQGNPLSGAAARITTSKQPDGVNAATDSTGRYATDSLFGPTMATITVSKERYLPVQITAVVDRYGLFSAPPVTLNSSDANLTIKVKKNTSKFPGATLKIRQTSQTGPVKATLTTNSNGIATYTHPFLGGQDSFAGFIEVIPPENSTALKQTAEFTLTPSMNSEIEIVCLTDDDPPAISDINIVSTADGLGVSWKTDEPAYYCVECKNSSGQMVEQCQWRVMGGTAINNKVISLRGKPYGKYQVKIIVKDDKGNEANSGFIQADWQGEPPPFVFKPPTKTIDSVTFSWSTPWPNTVEFGKYLLALESPIAPVEITDRTKTAYTLSGLNPIQTVCGMFKVISKTGETLYTGQTGSNNAQRFCVTTEAVAAQISNFHVRLEGECDDPSCKGPVNTVSMGKRLVAEAQATVVGSSVRQGTMTLVKFEVNNDGKLAPGTSTVIYDQNVFEGTRTISHEFVPQEAGTYDLTLTIVGFHTETSKTIRFTVVDESDSQSGSGDGNKETADKNGSGDSGNPAVGVMLKKIYTPSTLAVGKESRCYVAAQNLESVVMDSCEVLFLTGDGFEEQQEVSLGKKASKNIYFHWTPQKEGKVSITARVTCPGDPDPSDDEMTTEVDVSIK